MNKPIVSVLVPVYNVEEYLGRCLDSIMAQTLTDIEIICVNDGSTDGSLSILKKYQSKDERIKIVDKENGGLPSARNAGIDAACGEYVGFIDSDDYIEPNMFETLVKYARQDKSEIVICGANIFPETPRASQWLYDCLSPRYTHYDEFVPEVLFSRVDTTPFLWRNLVKKELIDRNNLRLDEDIVIGEDKAFQAKLFHLANGITVIPDKLYNYFWCRPDSLMQQQVYANFDKKVKAHAKLVDSIAKELFEKDTDEKTRHEYFEWVIPFIYSDFIYANKNDKIDIANTLIPTWKECGIYLIHNLLPEWKVRNFEYILKFYNESKIDIRLSTIIPIENDAQYVRETIENLTECLSNNDEIIIINNGMKNDDYVYIEKCLHMNGNIRLYNTPEYFPFYKIMNTGKGLASGKYVVFSETQNWYADSKALDNWITTSENENTDICAVNYISKESDFGMEEVRQLADKAVSSYMIDIYNCMFNKAFLDDMEVSFGDYSIFTGYVFLCEMLKKTNKIYCMNEDIYYTRKMHIADWISTEKCEKVLFGFEKLIDISIEFHDSRLHTTVLSILNGNRIKKLISNNTKPYAMPIENCPNGENSQINTVKTLFSITSMINYDMLKECGVRDDQSVIETLCEVIDKRNKFLGDLSNR